MLYLQFRKFYGHKTWQITGLCHGTITLSKKFFLFMNFFHLRIVSLILNRATIRVLFRVREKEPPILTFFNLYVTLHEIHDSIWPLNFVSRPSSYQLSFIYGNLTSLKKTSSMKLLFCLKSSHLCAITSIFCRVCLQTRLIYSFRLQIWNKIHDHHSSKIPKSETLVSIIETFRLTIKDSIWYILNFLRAVGNNKRV